MKQTANFKLNKPDYNDVADIADINNNMDIVDAAMYEHNFNKNNPHGVTKVQIGLGNVDNTADKNKSVLSATTASKLTATRLTNESLNSVIEVGDYWGAGGNTVTDFPDGASTNGTTVGGFTLVVNQAGGSGKLQIYTSDKGTWFRTGSISETAAAWNGWIKVYNSSNPVKINGTIFSGTMDITVPAAPIFTALSGKDLNAITENGFYGGGSGNNCSNLPKGVSAFLLIVSKNSNTGYTQIIVDSATQYMYIRNLINQNWQDWRNVSISVNSIPHYSYNEKIADGLDVYSIISPGKNMTLDVNKN